MEEPDEATSFRRRLRAAVRLLQAALRRGAGVPAAAATLHRVVLEDAFSSAIDTAAAETLASLVVDAAAATGTKATRPLVAGSGLEKTRRASIDERAPHGSPDTTTCPTPLPSLRDRSCRRSRVSLEQRR